VHNLNIATANLERELEISKACHASDDSAGGDRVEALEGPDGRIHLIVLDACGHGSVFGRLAGYEDVNDAKRLRHDPAMRWIVGGNAAKPVLRHRARWAALKRNGSPHRRIFPLLPTCPETGSIAFEKVS
jgi:hypothetical protein